MYYQKHSFSLNLWNYMAVKWDKVITLLFLPARASKSRKAADIFYTNVKLYFPTHLSAARASGVLPLLSFTHPSTFSFSSNLNKSIFRPLYSYTLYTCGDNDW